MESGIFQADNVVLVQFGGSIGIGGFISQDCNAAAIRLTNLPQKHTVGDDLTEDDFKDNNDMVVLNFTDTKQIEVLIDCLVKTKDRLLNKHIE